MTNKVNSVPTKRPETETPTVVDEKNDLETAKEKKLQRSVDRAAHKAAKTEQHYDEDHNTVSS